MEPSQILPQMDRAFPRNFDFYHLGKVELLRTEHSADLPLQSPDFVAPGKAIAFSLYGDFRAVLVLWFPSELDQDIYTELGNLLASKVASQLSKDNQLELMISPPNPLTDSQWEQLSRKSPILMKGYYAHHTDRRTLLVEAWILAPSTEEIRYA